MGWKDGQYFYSTAVLKDIASSYQHIYQGIEIYRKGIYRYTITNPWSIAEYKADFDTALRNIGRGKWTGKIDDCEFRDFRYYGRLQQIIIADMIGIEDWELEEMGFYRIPQMKGYAYHLMADRLNGEPHHGTRTQFISRGKTDVI